MYNLDDRVMCTLSVNNGTEVPGKIIKCATGYAYRVLLDTGEEIDTTTALMRPEEEE